MMLMEKVEYVSGGPTSPLSITNIVRSGLEFFFLFADGRHCPTLGKCRQVQQREITCGNNIKRNAGITMFPRERCQGLISCPSRFSGLPGLVGAKLLLREILMGTIRSGEIWEGVKSFNYRQKYHQTC